MNRFTCILAVMAVIGAHPFLSVASADTFGSGPNSFEIEFVPIGSPGNPPDTTGKPNPAGSVPYSYRIGKYEISEQMIDKANALGGLEITLQGRGPDKPATVNWLEAAQFVNWLNESKGLTPAYKFDNAGSFELWQPADPGYNPTNLYRNSLAKYFLPSVDEWYKAVYYDPSNGVYYDYPTGSDNVPDGIDSVDDTNFDAVFTDGSVLDGPNDVMNVGLLSPFGTAGQGGNVDEWEETNLSLVNDGSLERAFRGGSWHSSASPLSSSIRRSSDPNFGGTIIGFRIASVIPEPSSITLCIVGLGGVLAMRRRILA